MKPSALSVVQIQTRGLVVADNLREITLVVDDLWYEAIVNLTNEVYDGETCDWLRIEVI